MNGGTEYIFSELIDDVIEITLGRIAGKPIRFIVNTDSKTPKTLIGDAAKLKRTLLELLDSAGGYSSNGIVKLTIDSAVKNEEVELTITFFDSRLKDNNLTAKVSQGFTANERLAVVAKANEKRVLLYEPRQLYAISLAQTIENLDVHCILPSNQDEFYAMLKSSEYSHIFMPVFMLDSTKLIIKERRLNTKLIILTEYGEKFPDLTAQILSMPAYSVPVARILNNEK